MSRRACIPDLDVMNGVVDLEVLLAYRLCKSLLPHEVLSGGDHGFHLCQRERIGTGSECAQRGWRQSSHSAALSYSALFK